VGGESVNVEIDAVEWRTSDEVPACEVSVPCSEGVGKAGASELANMVDWNSPLAFGADATRRRKRWVAEVGALGPTGEVALDDCP